jgi:hypothetical protein
MFQPYQAPSNVFDDFDNGYTVGKWKDYKAPSNVFDELPELANVDHKVVFHWLPTNDNNASTVAFLSRSGGHYVCKGTSSNAQICFSSYVCVNTHACVFCAVGGERLE